MQKWSKGELGVMWLGIGAAVFVVAPIATDGIWTTLLAVAGVVTIIYGGVTAWQGMRKDPADRHEAGGDAPEEPPSSTDTDQTR